MGGGSYVARVRCFCTGGVYFIWGWGLSFFSLSPHIYAYIRHFLLFCPLVGVHLPTEQAISIAPHTLIPSPASVLSHYLAPRIWSGLWRYFGKYLGSYLMSEGGAL